MVEWSHSGKHDCVKSLENICFWLPLFNGVNCGSLRP